MSDTRLENDLFKKFQDLCVMVIGDAMIDSYIWGKVNRLSPEAPVPIVDVVERSNRLGGAANSWHGMPQGLAEAPALTHPLERARGGIPDRRHALRGA